MSTRAQREFLRVQLLETQRLKEMVGDHPLMSVSFAEREQELREKIAALPLGSKEARTVLFFWGEPVLGSVGIDVGFAGHVIEPFQSMVTAEYADRFHGGVGSRGRIAGEAQSRLLLTGLVRGSLGLELARADHDEVLQEGQLADTLAHVTRLVEAAGRSDEDFAAQLEETAPRVIQNLREFLEVIAKGKAGLRLESGDLRCSMNPTEASEAFNRVAGTTTREEHLTPTGVFKGALLQSWRFDFVTDDNESMVGKIDTNLTEAQVAKFNVQFFNQRCLASLLKTTVVFKNGRVRTTYTLQGLEALSETAG